MPKKRSEAFILEEPLIAFRMEPTEEEDPLFIDPTADISINNVAENEDEFALNGLSIFSPKIIDNKRKSFLLVKGKEEVKVKKEAVEAETVKVKEEPKDLDDDFDIDLPKEEEIDPVEAFAQALDKVEYLCPKCTFRSIDKEEVTQHFVSSHRVFQIGIPRPCDKCEFVGKTVRELAAHKKAKHPRTYFQDNLPTLPTGEFKCPHCDFTSFHKNNVRSHLKVHTQDTVYTCDKCPYTAISRLNIENHAARHLIKSRKKWKFKCQHCGLLERTEKLLQRHLILHGEGEMVKCQLCPYKSPYTHIISMHTRICHGIISKRGYEKEEKWKLRVRKSTRKCTRKTYNEEEDFEDDFEEEFMELPMRKNRARGRKKKHKLEDTEGEAELDEIKTEVDEVKTEEDEKSQDNPNNPNIDKIKEETNDTPRRPTLEERLGRARELINQHLSKKKQKPTVEQKEETVQNKNKEKEDAKEDKSGESQSLKSDVENPSGSEEEENESDNSENPSDEEGTGSKGEEWSEEESESYDGTTEESRHSFTSDKAPLGSTNNSSLKDNENSMTNSESLSKAESGDSKTDSRNGCKRRRDSQKSTDSKGRSDSETPSLDNDQSAKRLKIDSLDDTSETDREKTPTEKQDDTIESSSENIPDNIAESSVNNEDEENSMPAVLVFKRNGSSFTCIPKSNADSS